MNCELMYTIVKSLSKRKAIFKKYFSGTQRGFLSQSARHPCPCFTWTCWALIVRHPGAVCWVCRAIRSGPTLEHLCRRMDNYRESMECVSRLSLASFAICLSYSLRSLDSGSLTCNRYTCKFYDSFCMRGKGLYKFALEEAWVMLAVGSL